MAKSIEIGQKIHKYYIEDDQIKVVEGFLVEHGGRKRVEFMSDVISSEGFPGYKNIGRVWKGGEILWLINRDDELAKRLFTEHHVGVIKDLQKQIDEVGDLISMIRKNKVKSVNGSGRRSKCFGEIHSDPVSAEINAEINRQYKEGWDCSEFVNADQYAQRKISMLKKEMFINLSDEDVKHMRSLTTRGAIDAAVRAIINKYWV